MKEIQVDWFEPVIAAHCMITGEKVRVTNPIADSYEDKIVGMEVELNHVKETGQRVWMVKLEDHGGRYFYEQT